MKKTSLILLYILIAVFIPFEVFRGVIASYIHFNLPLGAGICLSVLSILMPLSVICLLILNAFALVKYFSASRLIMTAAAVVSLIILIFPYTAAFAELSAAAYSDERTDIAVKLQNGMLDDNKVGVGEYSLPNVFISYSGTVYYDGENVMFFLYEGFNFSRVLVYSPGGETIPPDAFSEDLPTEHYREFYDIESYSENWQIAKMK